MSTHESIIAPNCRCRRFELLPFRRFDSIYSCYYRSCRRFDVSLAINYLLSAFRLSPFRRVAGDQLNNRALIRFLRAFLGGLQLSAERKCELMRGRNDNRYEQFETSP